MPGMTASLQLASVSCYAGPKQARITTQTSMLHTTCPAQHALQPLRDDCHLSGTQQPGPGPQQPGLSPSAFPASAPCTAIVALGSNPPRSQVAVAANQHNAASPAEPCQ